MPIYSVKNASATSLVKAVRAVAGLDPSAGGALLKGRSDEGDLVGGQCVSESYDDESTGGETDASGATGGALRAEGGEAEGRAEEGEDGARSSDERGEEGRGAEGGEEKKEKEEERSREATILVS